MFNLLLIDPLRENMGNGGTNRNKPSNLGVSLNLCYTSIVIRMVIIRPKNNMYMYIYIYICMCYIYTYVLYLYYMCIICTLHKCYIYTLHVYYMYTCIYVYMYICVSMCVCVYVYMCICVVCIHIHPYINGSTTCNHDSNKK